MEMIQWLTVYLAVVLTVDVKSQASEDVEGFQSLVNHRLRKSLPSTAVNSVFKRRLGSGPLANLKIAAFNVRVFGKTKMSYPGVPDILVKIILRYDIILIMEIRDKTETAIDDLLNQVNRAAKLASSNVNNLYNKTVSPRLGRTASKEQYAFIYRTDLVSVARSYVYDDGDESTMQDTFEREPFIVQFRSPNTNIQDIVLVAIHISPSTAPAEIDALVDVYDDVISKWSIHDVIILGDLNSACSYMSDSDWKTNRLFNDDRFTWLISNCVDTTVGGSTCAYDRFVSAGSAMNAAVVPGTADRFKFDSAYNIANDLVRNNLEEGLSSTERLKYTPIKVLVEIITLTNFLLLLTQVIYTRIPTFALLQALKVSDHYPIEMELYNQGLSSALQSVKEVVEYKFYSRNPPSLKVKSFYLVGRSSNPLSRNGFAVEKTKSSSGAIATITNTKTVTSDQDALQAISLIYSHWNHLLTKDQVDLASYRIANKEYRYKSFQSATVKFVCKKIPAPVECWVALEM